MEFLDSLTLA
ncbi:hypothetical protein Zm00014a_043735 [Zea mays]|uniref:Uncharacterized protein n=1 Tax=Zea mays TaxID=4577 RepID=A0A3L6DRW8_MAIZE|nr:hypothetical protein Zm00014a_043735 [Zea mays]